MIFRGRLRRGVHDGNPGRPIVSKFIVRFPFGIPVKHLETSLTFIFRLVGGNDAAVHEHGEIRHAVVARYGVTFGVVPMADYVSAHIAFPRTLVS